MDESPFPIDPAAPTGSTDSSAHRASLINRLAVECHAIARDKGFYDHDQIATGVPGSGLYVQNESLANEKIMLIVTEAAEMVDARRDDDAAKEEEELADLMIRALDYAGYRGFDVGHTIEKKMAKNRQRPQLHGRSF